jgi:hypothetical protein
LSLLRTNTPDVRIQFQWPSPDANGSCDNFFFGAWHPSRNLRVAMVGLPPTAYAERRGPNWLLISAASSLHPPGTGLVHGTEDLGGLAFRGYVLPQLHSYSPESEVLAYWASRSFEEHNGVFSTAYIGRRGETLTFGHRVLRGAPPAAVEQPELGILLIARPPSAQ